ncbi:MAG TPA: heavy-metal-associated domain-containing protein [Geomonas sp.]|nr:heavy-metal-associated domain-containing protein [Geomonas sp.]
MSRNKIITSMLVLSAVSLLVLLAFHVRMRVTADSVVVLRTTGITCGSCASRINEAVQSVKGVAATEVDTERGWVIAGYDSKKLKPELIAQKVRASGFGSEIDEVLTPEQFKKITGRAVGQNAASSGGCCGKGGGCGGNRAS